VTLRRCDYIEIFEEKSIMFVLCLFVN